ncbi:MAG: hypothetical protein C4341_06535 [Armatimonadota bacterium]
MIWVATALVLCGCSSAEDDYVVPNTTQIQAPITDLGPDAAMKRVEAATRYLLMYVKEVGKFPDAQTGLDLKKLLREQFGDRVQSLGGNDDLTGFEFVWVRNDGMGPLLYNYGLAGKTPEEIADPDTKWLLQDPMQFPEVGSIYSYVSGRVAAVKRRPVAAGVG